MNHAQLETCRRRLKSRLPIIGGWQRRRALADLSADGSADAVQTLAGVVWRSESVEMRSAALDALRELAAEGNEASQEVLCRYVMHHDDIPVREEILAAGYVPKEASQRALFFFLTEQWPKYEALDFDHSLMKAIYDAANESLRRRITAVARDAGRLEWVGIASGGRQGRRLGWMTDAEWKAALSVLNEHERWPEMWRLAQDASPNRSAPIIRRLVFTGWKPPEHERTEFAELAKLASAWPNGELRAALDCIRTLRGHTDEIRCLAFHPSNTMIASGSGDRTVRLWRLADGQLLHTFNGHKKAINCLAVSPDGRLIASGGRDRRVFIWKLPAARTTIELKGHTQPVLCMAITPDSQILATGGADGGIQLWHLPDGKNLRLLDGHSSSVLALAIHRDGEILVSAGADAAVRLWSLPDGKLMNTLHGHRDKEADAVHCIAVSEDGRFLASGGTDGNVCLWNLPSGSARETLEGHLASVECLSFSPDGTSLASGGADQMVRLWRIPDGRMLSAWEAHSSDVTHLVFSRDAEWLASASGNGLGFDHSIRLWDTHERRWVKSLFGHDRYVTGLAVSADGRYLASASSDSTIRLWGSELARLCRTPAAQTSLQDLEWATRALNQDGVSESERNAVAYIVALIRRRRRYDVQVDAATPRRIEAGEFDIEIEGTVP